MVNVIILGQCGLEKSLIEEEPTLFAEFFGVVFGLLSLFRLRKGFRLRLEMA
jgi:hypothetical protein